MRFRFDNRRTLWRALFDDTFENRYVEDEQHGCRTVSQPDMCTEDISMLSYHILSVYTEDLEGADSGAFTERLNTVLNGFGIA